MNKKVAVFPGSFDPITKGHESIIKRALPLFDQIIVAIGVNSQKSYLFPLETREQWLKDIFKDEPKVKVVQYQKLTVELCKDYNAQFILRGLRNTVDFNYEKNIAQMNKAMESGIETIFYITDPELSSINATIVREIYKNGGDITQFMPNGIHIPPYNKA